MGGWREMRGFVVWGVVIVALLALPLVVWLTRGATANDVDSLNIPSPSASPRPSPSASPSPVGTATSLTSMPLCSQVWQTQKQLPTDYDGCQTGGKVYKEQKAQCLVTWDNRWWAKPGALIHGTTGPVADDKDFKAALSSLCA